MEHPPEKAVATRGTPLEVIAKRTSKNTLKPLAQLQLKTREKKASKRPQKFTPLHISSRGEPCPLGTAWTDTAQLKAALGKSWVQPKLSFTSEPPVKRPVPQARQGAQECALPAVQCNFVTEQPQAHSELEATPRTVEKVSCTKLTDMDSPLPGENLNVITWNVMGPHSSAGT